MLCITYREQRRYRTEVRTERYSSNDSTMSGYLLRRGKKCSGPFLRKEGCIPFHPRTIDVMAREGNSVVFHISTHMEDGSVQVHIRTLPLADL